MPIIMVNDTFYELIVNSKILIFLGLFHICGVCCIPLHY